MAKSSLNNAMFDKAENFSAVETFSYYIQRGVWDIFDALIHSSLSADEKLKLQKFLWSVAVYPEKLSFPSNVIDTPWKQSLVAISLLRKVAQLDGESSPISLTDLNNLKKEVEFEYQLHALSVEQNVFNELADLHYKVIHADKTKQSVGCLSSEAVLCLRDNLFTNTVITNDVIQKLLCLWCPYFTDTDNQLQDLYKEVLWTCINFLETHGTPGSDITHESSDDENKKYQNVLLCLLSIMDLSEERSISLTEWLSARLDKLCCDGLIPRKLVYLALIGRGRLGMLHALTQVEDERQGRGTTARPMEPFEKLKIYIRPDGNVNAEELFYCVVKSKKHFVQEIVMLCIELLKKGCKDEVVHCLSSPVLKPLWVVLLFYAWSNIPDHCDVVNILTFLVEKCKETVEEETFLKFLSVLEHYLTVLQWTEQQSLKHRYSNRALLNFFGEHSCLEIIKRTTDLANVNWEEVRSLLDPGNAGASDWEIVIFDGFCALMTAFKVIEAGMEIEDCSKRLSKSNEASSPKYVRKGTKDDEKITDVMSSVQYSYSENVKKELELLKKIINDLFPLTFRIEMLENIFSLLFLRYEDLQDESPSESGAEEEDTDIVTQKSQKFVSLEILSSQEVSSIKDIPVIKAQVSKTISDSNEKEVTEETNDQKQSKNKEDHTRKPSVASSDTSHLRTSQGFVCNKYVVRDLLYCLKECLANCSSTFYGSLSQDDISKKSASVQSSVKPETLQKRMNRLSQYVSEAMWRLLLLTSEEFVRQVGEIPECGILPVVEETSWFYPADHSSSSSDSEEEPSPITQHSKKQPHHQRLYSDAEKSSGSGSQSATAGSATNPTDSVKSRRKFSRKISKSFSTSNNIVSLMLSSQTSLAVRCISLGNHVKAKEVIQMFESEGNLLATEIKFAEAYQNLRKKLCSIISNAEKRSATLQYGKPQSLFQSIQQAAEAGVHSTSISSIVETFLSMTTCPSIPDYEDIMRDYPQYCGLFHGVDNPVAIAAMDLALTTGTTFQHSVALLDVACKHCPEICASVHDSAISNAQPRGKKPVSYLNFMEYMIQILKIVNKQPNTRLPPGALPTNISLCQMLNTYEIPLCPKKLQRRIYLLERFSAALNEFCLEINSKENIQKSSLNTACQKLVHISNSGLFSEENTGISYLHGLYKYVRGLYSLQSEYFNRDSSLKMESGRPVKCFDVLNQSVTDIVAHLLFEQGIPPENIEVQLKKLNINLMYNIMKICCPYVPSATKSVQAPVSNSIVVLNDNIEMWSGHVRHPEVAVRSILLNTLKALRASIEYNTGIITYKDIKILSSNETISSVLEETKELASVDLSLLTTDLLVFLINLSNLLFIHGLLTLNFKMFQQTGTSFKYVNDQTQHVSRAPLLERLMCMKSIGYKVGDKILSLYELHELLLGKHLVSSLDNIIIDDSMSQTSMFRNLKEFGDPKLLFALISGWNCSPKIQVFQPDNFNIQLDNSIVDYVSNNVKVTDTELGKQLDVPELIQYYISCNQQNEEENCSKSSSGKSVNFHEDNRQILDFVLKNSCGDLHELLSSLPPGTPMHVRKYSDIGIIMDYNCKQSEQTQNIVEPSSNIDSSDVPWKRYTVDESIVKYLENQCWLLSFIVQNLHEVPLEVSTPVRRASCTETFDCRTKFFNSLLESDSIAELSAMFGRNRTLAALYFEPPNELLWSHLNKLVKDGNWVKVLDVLWSLPYSVKTNAKLQHLFDIALYKVACSPESSLPEEFTPWWYSEHIIDIDLQAKCIFSNMSRWPTTACKHALNVLLGRDLASSDREQAGQLLVKITLYEKILSDFSIPSVTSWYDLNILSVENPAIVMDALIQSPVCIEWTKLHEIPTKAQHLIDSRFLSLLLRQDKIDYVFIRKLLHSLPVSQTVLICTGVLRTLRALPMLRFVVTFILDGFTNQLTAADLNMYNQYLISIKLLEILPQKELQQYIKLTGYPLLIIEVLLMNTRLEVMGKVMTVIAEFPSMTESVNTLIKIYATKALDLGVYYNDGSSKSSSSEHKSYVSETDSPEQEEEFEMPLKPPAKNDWMPDDQVSECKCCKAVVFSMFNRRHHCRRCGRVICSACSTWRMLVDGYGDVSVRVCNSCYEQTHSLNTTSSRRKQKCPSLLDVTMSGREKFSWLLSADDESYNCTVRDEFAYEHAPSVSLCLSIIKLCSEDRKYCSFLMDSCNSLMINLWDDVAKRNDNPQLDYNIVLHIIRSLVIAAKVKYSDLGDQIKVYRCDELLSEVDVLSTLVEGGCSNLLPTRPLDDGILRKIRDQLVEEELWTLALDVSTKAGLDKIGVWATWGKACLRAGCWEAAREKFSHCLEKVSGTARDPPLLTEIIKILETNSCSISSQHWHPAIVPSSSSSSRINEPGALSSPVILHTLSTLKDIAQGNYPQAAPPKNTVIIGPRINPYFYNECQYYLTTYGSRSGMLTFYLNHDDLSKALKYVLSQNVEPETFFECVYMRCLRENQISSLHTELSVLDASLEKWKTYLQYSCSQLARQNLFHVLYELQVFMKDYVRAAMTSIRFYYMGARSYSELAENINHLHKACEHLKTEFATTNWSSVGRRTPVSVSSLTMKLEPKELNKHLNTIDRQLEITKFLQNRKCRYDVTPDLIVPTLFGNNEEKMQVAVLVALCGRNIEEGFGLTFRIIQDYHLNALQVYISAGKKMAAAGCLSDVEQLVKCIKSSGVSDTSTVCDKVLLECIEILSIRPDCSDVEPVIKQINDVGNKINAFVKCRQLKSAYLIAVKHDRLQDIRCIQKEAKRLGQTKIEQICSKRLGES